MKLEFLMCGSPNDAFFSQAAMFRLSLDSLGPTYQNARVVLCVGSPHAPIALPERWEKPFESIELHWADAAAYAAIGDGAQGHALYRLMNPDADLSIICDADTMMIAPLPDDFLHAMAVDPAICGVIAHFGPPLASVPGSPNPALASDGVLWAALAEAIVGRGMPLDTPYTLATDGSCGPNFYINHAFLAAPPRLMKEFYQVQEEIRPTVRSIIDNRFYDQITVAMAAEKSGLPCRQVGMRFNFPNDPRADDRYPGELRNVVLLHYLRTKLFNRHRIFANPSHFDEFMSLHLAGSDALFQGHVRRLTNGVYPFPVTRAL